MPQQHEPPFELAVTCHIAAPPETVWQMITESLPEYWCPQAVAIRDCGG